MLHYCYTFLDEMESLRHLVDGKECNTGVDLGKEDSIHQIKQFVLAQGVVIGKMVMEDLTRRSKNDGTPYTCAVDPVDFETVFLREMRSE